MGYLKYVKKLFQKPSEEATAVQRERLIAMRREPVTIRIERPTNIATARSLGYKAKQGLIIVRQRVIRGGRQRPDIKGGRRSAHSRQRKVVKKNYQQIAEERANKVFKNCEVMNSYKVAQDGTYYWYEIIMVDRYHPVVLNDKQLAQVATDKGRAFRGITSAGRKGRGLRKKGIGAEKIRPSLRSKKRLH
ncbi:50S ribosomal protein L15e [Candidatus Woesearchaeota archaeon]|nr:50S ribosomal protein L15e [Candidatus Woesearchaeota archaeon]